MRIEKPSALNKTEALRFLGVCREPDPATKALLDDCEGKLLATIDARFWWKEFPRAALPEKLCGRDLQLHLKDCEALVLMAVTLGSETDRLLRRAASTDIARAAVLDALASAAVEQLCDNAETLLRGEYKNREMYLTGRYSPGYGDCPLELQQRFCDLLDTGRSMGLFVSENNLLTPRKSVTAVLGVARKPVTGFHAGCDHCVLRQTCTYRKRGVTCESERLVP